MHVLERLRRQSQMEQEAGDDGGFVDAGHDLRWTVTALPSDIDADSDLHAHHFVERERTAGGDGPARSGLGLRR